MKSLNRIGRMPGWLRANRNMLLFVAMLSVVVTLPAFEDSRPGELRFAVVNTSIILVAVAANGRSRPLFWTALAFAVIAATLRAISFADDRPVYFVWSWVCCAAVMLTTNVRLLREMFVVSTSMRERLFACATNYLVIGLLWCYLYAIGEHFAPGSFPGLSQAKSLHVPDLAYFSFNIVTGIALTSVQPATRVAQMLVILQEFVSVLYLAFVISRLVGIYGPVGGAGAQTDPASGKGPSNG